MRRALSATFIIAVSMLVIVAAPASASSAEVVASANTTDTDFNNAATLSGVVVNGTGTSASVELDPTQPSDIANVVAWFDANQIEGVSDGAAVSQWDDEISGQHVTQGTGSNQPSFNEDSINGQPSVTFDGNDLLTNATAFGVTQPYSVIVVAEQDATGRASRETVFAANAAAGQSGNTELDFSGNRRIFAGNGLTGGTADTDPHVVTAQFNGASSSIRVDGTQVASGDAGARDITEDITIGAGPAAGNAIDGEVAEVIIYEGSLSTADRDALEEYLATKYNIAGPADADNVGTYISSNHSVTDPTNGFTNLTLNNVTAHVTWEETGGSTWSTVASQTFTTSGNKTIDISSATQTTLRVNVTFEQTGAVPVGQLQDEGVMFNDQSPTVDNSSASPSGSLKTATPMLSIDVSDREFPTAQGDSVDVEFFVDGSSVGTDTLTSNGTASIAASISMGGSHTWHAVATDAYGLSQTSQTFNIETPGNLSIRKELLPDELVSGAEVEIVAYYSNEVERKSTTNGNISLSGFPIDQPIIVRVNASGYYTRTAIIEDVFQQQSVYLLNNSTATYLVRFDLQDITGQFPRNNQTVLFVERDLNRSGTTNWQIIAGDNFGVQGVPVNLAQDERYRLRVKNLETGDVTVVGAYTAIQSETVNVKPQPPDPGEENADRDYYWQFTQDRDAKKITFEYVDEASSTVEVKLTIFERYNSSNILVDNDTFSSNNITYDIALSNAEANATWMAELYIDRGDGFTRFLVPVSGGGISLIPTNLDGTWVSAIGVFIMLIVSMAFSQLNVGVGAVVTPLVGGALWWFGVFSGQAAGASIVLALVIGVAYYARSGGGI